MPVLDRREPGVYVSIEDASYVSTSLEIGRTVYTAGLCPKGPHNRVVEINGNQAQFHKLFGKPNFTKTSQTHYLADKALQYGARLLYVRVMPEDSKISNVVVKKETTSVSELLDYEFTTAIKPKLTINQDTVLTVAINTNDIVFKESVGKYYKYDDVTSIPIGSTLKYRDVAVITTNEIGETITSKWSLVTNESNIVTTTGTIPETLAVGQWVYFGGNGTDLTSDDSNNACQIISIDRSNNKIYLNRDYVSDVHTGSAISLTGKLMRYIPVKTDNIIIDQDRVFLNNDTGNDTDGIYYMFYAIGAGEYGNNYKVIASRNTELEKIYTNDDGTIKYKYLFANIGIYELNENNEPILKEGPFVVSLTERTPDGVVIRDLSSGNPLYIIDIINKNSELIRVVEGGEISALSSESIRLQVLLTLAGTGLTGTNTVALDGTSMIFANGDNGTVNADRTVDLYSTNGILRYDDYIYGQLKNAFNGSLTSIDGSIEQLREVTYPLYNLNYIVSGGLPAWVQDGARFLAEYREDTIHLGDTGSVSENYKNDINLRITDVSWNNWTSALYIQYRKIKDSYTGLDMWMTPVYHAIERHLAIDGIAFIAEPVAGIEKGAITEPIELRYKANHIERGDLIEAELNPVIVEPDGTYILSQFTTWKRLSVMKRLHVAKFVAYCRQMIPPLVKDLLQRRATPYWVKQGESRVNYFLSQFCGSSSERYNILQSFSVSAKFDETSSELNIYVTLKPFRAIEKINVFIAVQ